MSSPVMRTGPAFALLAIPMRPITMTKRNIATPTRSVGSLDGMRKWQEAGWPPPESTGGEQILPLPPRCSDR